ncbi:hypothetical protein [Aestuariivivens sediminis]|uniref:hypothetical protein n=1 Tax=Aestuariivivens sediminis TaxID=2913557 RepID=UPI003B8A7FF6
MFGRIRRKLLEESNLKKYLIYAIGEILLIIIGILIALQIDKLNDESKLKRTLISDLKNTEKYIQGEIERVENERQKLIAMRDTIGYSLRIIEDLDTLSSVEKKYIKGTNNHLLKVGLATGEKKILQDLYTSISKSPRESSQELVNALSRLIIDIQKADFLDNSFFEDLLSRDRSMDRTIWRTNSKGQLIYDFKKLKTDYDLQIMFNRSIHFKNISINYCKKLIEQYRVVGMLIGKQLNELE